MGRGGYTEDEWERPAKRWIKESLEGGVGGVCACVCCNGKAQEREIDNIQ